MASFPRLVFADITSNGNAARFPRAISSANTYNSSTHLGPGFNVKAPRSSRQAVIARLLPVQLVALAVLLAGNLVFAPVAQAACPAQEEAGSWTNAYSQTNSIARINLRFICQDRISDGRPFPPGPAWIVQVFGVCEPYDCDWEKTAARRLSTGHLYAIYDQGFAIRHVYARMSAFREGQLWVYTWTDFKESGRPDYGVHNWFVRK